MKPSCFKTSSNVATEKGLLQFLLITENIHLKNYNQLQIKTEIFSELEFLPKIVARAITADTPNDHDNYRIHSIRSMITEKLNAQKPNQNTSTGSRPQTQSTSVNSNLKEYKNF